MTGAEPTGGLKALRAVLRALQIGVYTRRGRAIERGAERGVRDFDLYDFEVDAIAGTLTRHQAYALSDLSGLLSHVSRTQVSAGQLGARTWPRHARDRRR